MRKKAHFERNPRSVIVNVTPPVTHVAITERAYQDWKPVASQIISDVQTETPANATVSTSKPSATRQQPRQPQSIVKPTIAFQEVDDNAILYAPRKNTEKYAVSIIGGADCKTQANYDTLMSLLGLSTARKSDATIIREKGGVRME